MKKFILLLLLLISFVNAEDKASKVVFDLTTSSMVVFEKQILKSIAIHKAYYESNFQDLEVAVVIHGESYKFFLKSIKNTSFEDDKELRENYAQLKKRIAALSSIYDVEFLMCKVGMQRNSLEEKNIVDFVKLVATSTVGLIDKQNQGFAYIPVRD